MAHTAKAARAELILSLGVLVFGLAAAVVAWRLPEGGGYARIGPNFMPKLVSGGLILLGVWLLVERFTGGWREPVASDPAARGEHAFLPSAFVWVSAGLLAQMVLINSAGFVLAAAVLFACVARGFGSYRWASRPGARPGARSRRLRVLRLLPERQPAGGLAAAAPRRGRHLSELPWAKR